MPNFRDILQKLSVFKNNLSLLLPVVIGLIAVLLFVPTQLMSSKLKERVEQDSIWKLGNKARDLEENAVSRDQYEKEAQRQEAHANDANEIAALALQSTQRELLSYDIFPEPDPNGFSGLIFQEFGQRLRSGIDGLIARVGGGDCPTDAELDRGLEDSSARSGRRGRSSSMRDYAGSGGSRGRMGMYGSMYGGMGSAGNIRRMIVDEMCQARARSISVYVKSVDLSGYEYWGAYKYDVEKDEAVKDCWYHQLAYWVIEDIFDTMDAMNSEYDSVMTAPVKRFLRISFTMGLKRPRSDGGVFRGGRGRRRAVKDKDEADKPVYVRSDAEGLTESCTGRYSESDSDIDVIHFNVAFVVSAKAVLPLMQELCSAKEHKFDGYPEGQEQTENFKHNQISVLESKIGSVDPKAIAHRYYSYGEDSVVELDLICEYAFNKKGYEKIKPESVKKTLAGEDQTTGQ
ncbi:MAG: hypothetical protein ACYSYV_08840 [Planctomycetota bacterium]